MNKKRVNIICVVIMALTFGAVLCVYPSMPDTIPTHWNVHGQVDGMGPKWSVFIFVLLPLLVMFGEKLEPKKEGYSRFENVFNIFKLMVTVFTSLMVMVTVTEVYKPGLVSMNTVMYLSMGAMFALLGNYMPKVKHNYTFGIKTPWTIASETVWNKTHRMAGPLWMVGGIVVMAMVFVKDQNLAFTVSGVVLGIITVIPMVYSYIEQKRENKPEK